MAVSIFVLHMPIVKIKVLTKTLGFISSLEVFLRAGSPRGVYELEWVEPVYFWTGLVSEPEKCV